MKNRTVAGAALLVALKLTVSIAAAVTAASLAGCNTVQGVGHDISAVGEGGQNLIDDATGTRPSRKR